MSVLTLDDLRGSLEGGVPPVLATCAADGTPNVSLISQAHYVDPARVALSYQFFNKTRRNLLETGSASLAVMDPETLAQHRLSLEFEETRAAGPLFETMRARLAGIASHTGMEGVFRLLGADVFRVLAIEPIDGPTLPPQPRRRDLLAGARRACADLASAADLEELLDRALAALERRFGVEHAMALMRLEGQGGLTVVCSRGYATSGVGSEVALGEGLIGVAAREETCVRIGHMTSDYRYGAAIRAAAGGDATRMIAFPGLTAPGSQIALPIAAGGRLLGVLFAEDPRPLRFSYDDEDALAIVAAHIGALMAVLRRDEAPVGSDACADAAAGRPVIVRWFPSDDSVFLDNDYLIKGVAGAIFWRLLRERAATGRSEFCNRELRLDASLRLPEHAENLDARLVLLRRRLDERGACIRIEKCGRGRFRLVAERPVVLEPACEPGASARSVSTQSVPAQPAPA